MHPILTLLTGKPFIVLRRKGWLSKELLPAHKATKPLPDPQDFEFFQGGDGLHVSLRGEGGTPDELSRFAVKVDLDSNGELEGTGSVAEGSLIVHEPVTGGIQPKLAEPHVWAPGFFPVSLTGIVLECSIVLKLTWSCVREVTVGTIPGVDIPTSKYERRLMVWGLDTITVEVIDTSVSTDTLLPVYDWATNTATTFVELATVTENLTEADKPVIEQLVHSDLVLPHPLTHDLETKPEVAFPPGNPDGPNDDRPIVFHRGGVTTLEMSDGLSANLVGYCTAVQHGLRKVNIRQRTMFTLAGSSTIFHEMDVDPSTPRAVATLETCDPLA